MMMIMMIIIIIILDGDGRGSGESETRFHDVSEYLSSSDEVNKATTTSTNSWTETISTPTSTTTFSTLGLVRPLQK